MLLKHNLETLTSFTKILTTVELQFNIRLNLQIDKGGPLNTNKDIWLNLVPPYPVMLINQLF